MRFAFSDEQQALKSEARRFLQSAPTWERIVELGWTALAIPERYGGLGLGWVELCAILEETGRVLLAQPLFATSIAANALLSAGNEAQKREYLPRIAAGARAALVHEGRALDGMGAELLIIAAADGVQVISAPNHKRELSILDPTRSLAEIMPRGGALHEDILARASVALAAEQVGGAERCLELAVDYAKTRQQFGRPIGSFQAIQHMCADMLVRVESARSACYWAAWTAATGGDELLIAASLAGSYCTEAFFRCAADNIQIHGGIGFTWEHDAHRFFRRARASAALFADPQAHREEVARRLGL